MCKKLNPESSSRRTQPCEGENQKSEICKPKIEAPVTRSKTSIAEGTLTLKNLTISGLQVTNNVLEAVLEDKEGEIYKQLKKSTEESLFAFFKKSNPDVESVKVLSLSVGSLVVDYIVTLKASNRRITDLIKTFPNETVTFFKNDSVFQADTSAKFSQITGKLISSRKIVN